MRQNWIAVAAVPLACLCAILFAVVLLGACNSSRSLATAPTPVSPTPVSPSDSIRAQLYALSGVVKSGGVLLEGAAVTLLNFEAGASIASTLTDGNGSYILPEVRNVEPRSGALVSVSKLGYFTDTRYVLMSQTQRLDVDLERAANISLGEFVQSPVGNARCASLGYGGMGGALCQRFALAIPASGTLEVRVSSVPASPFDLTILKPEGTVEVYHDAPVTPLLVNLQVAGGLTYQIDVVAVNPSTREFVLATALR